MVRSNDDEAGTVTQDDGTLEDSRNEEEEDSLSDNPEIPDNVALRELSKANLRMARRTGLSSRYPRVVNSSTVDQRSAGEGNQGYSPVRRREEDRRGEENCGDGGGNRGYSPVRHLEKDRRREEGGDGGGNRGYSPVRRRGQSPSLSPTPVKQIPYPTIPSPSKTLNRLEENGDSLAN